MRSGSSIGSRNVLRLILVLAGMCSAAISAVLFIGDVVSASLYVPGILFTLAVFLPWARGWSLPPWKAGVLVLLGIAGYEAAVFIVYPTRFALAPLAGFVGTSLSMLVFLFDTRPALRRAALLLIGAGTLLGAVFFAAFALNIYGIMIGIVTWQIGIAALLAMLLPTASREREVLRVVVGRGPSAIPGLRPGDGGAPGEEKRNGRV